LIDLVLCPFEKSPRRVIVVLSLTRYHVHESVGLDSQMRKKALLAVLLASVVLNSSQASLAVENDSTVSLKTRIKTFSESNEVPPERRCYQLVSFAFQMLRGQESSITSGYWCDL